MSIVQKIKNFYAESKVYFYYKCCKRYNLNKIINVAKIFSVRKMKHKMKLHIADNSEFVFINTPDGFAQCVHPDVIKIRDHNYIMALTPYPFGDDAYENPVIYESEDLKDWQYISGPLDYPKIGSRNHLSDVTLVKENEKISCYYRECLYSCEPQMTNIYRQTSVNMRDWADKELVFSGEMNKCDIISPKILNDENGWRMYMCVKGNHEIRFAYTTDMPIHEDKFVYCNFINMPTNKMLWHMSAVKHKGGDILLLTLSDDFGGINSELYIGWKCIKNNDIVILKKVNLKNVENRINIEYRADGIIEDNMLKIICSVQFKDKTWGVVTVEERNVERLFEEI